MNISLRFLIPYVSSLLVGLSGLLSPVDAAIISYDFTVDIDSGSLLGNSYTGFFSYDDASVTPTGFSSADLTNFAFDFLGSLYTLNDDLASVARFSAQNLCKRSGG
jgi:hypothetical protein